MSAEDALARGQQALKQGRWADARTAFESILAVEDRVEAYQGLGDALWWLGDAPGCLEAMERSYKMYREAGADFESALMCLWLAGTQLKCFGNKVACSGWISTGARIVEQNGLEALKGWICWARAGEASDPATAAGWAEQSLMVAREQGDRDLELCSLAEMGKGLVGMGRAAEGMALIDEAMAAALGGESQSLDTVVIACCSMMGACDQAADLERVAEWCRAADKFMKTYGSPFLFADCRMRYGSVLAATGHWADAERELKTAVRATTPDSDYHHKAVARLSGLRLRQGRLEEADALLTEIQGLPASLLPQALLHYRRGEHGAAERLLERYLSPPVPEPVERAEAMDLLVDCLLDQGRFPAAATTVEGLAELASKGSDRLAAHHAFAAARLVLASGVDPEDAEVHLERAMRLFSGCGLPYETARTRLALAESLAGRPEVAAAEAQGAFATFERLGATGDADAAAQLIRSLGGSARTGPKDFGVLTKREQEVLRLVGAGLSNPEIAERLYLSRKTVSHHVSNILSKLGVRNRAEAAIQASRLISS